MKVPGIAVLIDRFSDLPDSRVQGRTDHDLLDIVVLALCAVMSGAEGWDDIEDWGRERVSRCATESSDGFAGYALKKMKDELQAGARTSANYRCLK